MFIGLDELGNYFYIGLKIIIINDNKIKDETMREELQQNVA